MVNDQYCAEKFCIVCPRNSIFQIGLAGAFFTQQCIPEDLIIKWRNMCMTTSKWRQQSKLFRDTKKAPANPIWTIELCRQTTVDVNILKMLTFLWCESCFKLMCLGTCIYESIHKSLVHFWFAVFSLNCELRPYLIFEIKVALFWIGNLKRFLKRFELDPRWRWLLLPVKWIWVEKPFNDFCLAILTILDPLMAWVLHEEENTVIKVAETLFTST
uniref:Uncharacterized protein n=1 Tax=Strigamia maritima TaxID=126957 RepID=T1IRR6_STRMM